MVLKGSQARPKWTGSPRGYANLFDQLVQDKVLVEASTGERVFSQDHGFSSPSAAAAVISGRSANGRTKWTLSGKKQNYGDWQNELLSAEAPETE